VAISVERYYAICHPLRSRRWQTLSHAYRLIAAVWTGSLLLMTPVAALSELQPTIQGVYVMRRVFAIRISLGGRTCSENQIRSRFESTVRPLETLTVATTE
jgi:hypothetical protein